MSNFDYTNIQYRWTPSESGYAGSREEPPSPGEPAQIWVEAENGEPVTIAEFKEPIYHAIAENDWDDGERGIGHEDGHAEYLVRAATMFPELVKALEVMRRHALSTERQMIDNLILKSRRRVKGE